MRTLLGVRAGAIKVVLCLCGLLAGTAAAADFRLTDDPAWFRQEPALAPGKTTTASDGLKYQLVSDRVDLTGARPVWNRQVAYEVMREAGLADAGQVSIYYQPAFQDVQVHAIEILRDGQLLDRRGSSRYEVLRRESDLESGLLDGGHTLNITIPDIRVGDRVEYRYSVAGYNPVFGQGYHDFYSAKYNSPLGVRRLRFVYPQDMPLRWRTDVPGFSTRQTQGQGVRGFEVLGRDLERVAVEDAEPASYNGFGRFEVSTAADWAQVSAWAVPLYPARFTDRELAASLVRKLRLDPTDTLGSITRATEFVQGEVRYTGLDMGVNSHAPNQPETVIERRFGDCKDKTSLLIALLREAGIAAEPVLVHTEARAAVRERLPSPLAFNHVIVRAKLDGKDVWIDPTRSRERGAFAARQPLSFRVGLPISATSTGLVEIPDPFPAQPLVKVDQQLKFAEQAGTLSADFVVDTSYFQGWADGTRADFDSRGPAELGKAYLSYMQGFYEGLTADTDPEAAEKGDAFAISERYRLAWNKEREGSLFGIVLFQVLDWVPKLKEGKRTAPLALGGPRHGWQTVRSKNQDGWSIEASKDVVENEYFHFARQVRVEGEELVIQAQWRRLADEVPARDYAQVRKDLNRVRELLQYDIDLEPSPLLFSAGIKDWLWPLASLVGLAVCLAALWRVRARNSFAGMLYRPRLTLAALAGDLQHHAGGLWVGWAWIVLSVVLEYGPRWGTKPLLLFVGMLVGGALAMMLRWLAMAGLLKFAFHLIGVPLRFMGLVKASGWACAPSVLCMAFAMVAFRFDPTLLAEEHAVTAATTPALLIGGVLVIVGMLWSLIAMVNAYAGLGQIKRRKSLAACVLAIGIALPLLVPLVVLVMASR